MKRARIIFFFALMVFGCLLQALAAQKAPTPDKPLESSGPMAVITVKTVINPSTADFIIESIHRAERENAQCLIIQLDTPGGLLDSTREIVLAFFASRVPIIVYVAPSGARAGSAGVFITMASHVAAMAPGTNIGAAHPVNGSGQDIQGDMRKKTTPWRRSNHGHSSAAETWTGSKRQSGNLLRLPTRKRSSRKLLTSALPI
jgi:membrane-bound serine protease (ClpP class)